jgi:hypothetical protein
MQAPLHLVSLVCRRLYTSYRSYAGASTPPIYRWYAGASAPDIAGMQAPLHPQHIAGIMLLCPGAAFTDAQLHLERLLLSVACADEQSTRVYKRLYQRVL